MESLQERQTQERKEFLKMRVIEKEKTDKQTLKMEKEKKYNK